MEVSACYSKKEKEEGMVMTYKVQDFEKKEDMTVEFDRRVNSVSRLCGKFEYSGYLCRHAMAVMHGFGVFNIPNRYIY